MTDCNVIADLIPLYIDSTCSHESAELVEEHIKTCEGCTKLLETMRAEGIELKKKAPALESKKLFKSVRKSLVIVILSLCVMFVSYFYNYFNAYYGNTWTLLFTMLYVTAWMVLTVHVREIIPLISINFAFGLLYLILDIFHFVKRFLLLSGILTAEQYVNLFVLNRLTSSRATYFYLIGIPYHGVTNLADFKYVYPISTVVSLVVIIYSIISLKNWKKYRS